MDDPWQIIRRPVLSDKGYRLMESRNQYLFEVDKCATKIQIRQAIELIYQKRGIKVAKVRTMHVLGKSRRVRQKVGKRRDWKKAIITLRKGDQIELL
jgi:large subunit ribosomal protein L23